METKTHYETDLAIYRKLAAMAQEVFTNVACEIGAYSAQEVCVAFAKQQMRWQEDYDTHQTFTVEHGTFRCTVSAENIFHVLRTFGTTVKIETKDRVKLLKRPSAAETAVSFTLPKHSRELARAVAKDPMCPQLEHVCVDTRRRAIVACDRCLLTALAVPGMKVSEEARDTYLVSPKLVSSGTLSISRDSIAFSEDNFAPCMKSDTLGSQYPNWARVFAPVYSDRALPLGTAAFKQLKKAVKSCANTALDMQRGLPVTLSARRGDRHITVSAKDQEFAKGRQQEVKLPCSVPIDFSINFNPNLFQRIPTAETIYLPVAWAHATTFVWQGGCTILMPMYSEEEKYPKPEGEELNVLELSGIETPAAQPTAQPKVADTGKKHADKKKENKPKPASKIVPFVPPVPKPQPTPPQPEPDEDDLCPDYPEDAAPTVTVLIPNPLVHPSLAIATIDNEDCPEL